MKKRIAEISLAIALIFSVIVSVVGFNNDCRNLRNDVLRLHILANSDSDEDQQIKLAVRDSLLSCGKNLFSGETDLKNVEKCLKNEKAELIAVANKVLRDNGFDYKADIYFAEEYFTTRSYGRYTLPAGKYNAVKVILGNGEGKNWWCVMFPPLCLPAASEREDVYLSLNDNDIRIIESNPEYDIRFKIIEIIEKIKYKYINYNSI